ncbi:MAG TPA: 2TM domain-containing protein [Acidimicrobiales bacterium]|nr:2TM domain-containing protein [Acidimicrobiales bacterium]
MTYAANHESDEWQQARKRVTERRDFGAHVVTYVVVNAFLVVVWSITGHGYFWPVWILAGWGMGLVLHAWDVFLRRPVTDSDIEAELRRRHD